MKENLINRMRSSSFMKMAHMALYVFLILYASAGIYDICAGDRFYLIEFIKYIGVDVFCIVFIQMEMIFHKENLGEKTAYHLGCFYYGTRVVMAGVAYFIKPTQMDQLVFYLILIAFMADFMMFFCFTSFDYRGRRGMCDGIYALGFSLISMVQYISRLYAREITGTNFLRGISISFGGLFVLIAMGEVLAYSWGYYEKRMFAQNRALDDLNEANEALQQQQEKIEKINEKLGNQKIKLQAANKRINRSHDEMSVQNEISSSIAASPKRDELLNKVANILHLRLDLDLVMIIMEEDNSLLVPGEEPKGRFVAVSTTMGDEYRQNLIRSVKEMDMQDVLSLSKTYMQNVETDTVKLFHDSRVEFDFPSVIILPVNQQEERLGTLIVAKNTENAFMDGRAFYESIASQLSIGISNAKLYEKMNDMAIRDGLTRIYNRRHLNECLNEYLSEAMVKKLPVTLALFDIDKFKMINDTYGHQCGDEVIRYVAALLNKGAISHGGIAGRYGGEEFVIAFLGKSLEEAYEIVQQVHQQIKSKPVIYGESRVDVRTSAGVACYPETCSNPSELLTRADWAMYHSKKNGRDQITIDSDQITDKM